MDPSDIFEYPDEENVSWNYNVEESSNDEGRKSQICKNLLLRILIWPATSDDSEDPFAFVMIDSDESAYDESLVDQWSFLDDSTSTLSKRESNLKQKRDIFTFRNDTFDNVVETYRIQCKSLFFNMTGCQSIFKGGASNTFVKLPPHIGSGPYARVISLIPEGSTVNGTKRGSHISPRSSTEVYDLTVDYDLASAAQEKGDVNFRIDYTNLLEYW